MEEDPDPHSSKFVDPGPHTINPDPHHWLQRGGGGMRPPKKLKNKGAGNKMRFRKSQSFAGGLCPPPLTFKNGEYKRCVWNVSMIFNFWAQD